MIGLLLKVIKKFLKYVFAPLFVIALIWVTYFLLLGNFHKVDKDLYRSAQLFTFNMPYYIEKHQIKSIINLRGESDKKWYKDEIRFSKENNITHYDYGIGDRRISSMKEMNDMVNLMKNAPKPLLIHCKAGADRTSLAAALYLYEKNNKDAKDAISLLYGHFPWLGSKTCAMDKSFEKYTKEHPKK
ncbi:MAG TPA: protein tyrosine phosphatase [Sulfurimonas autotrophica]|nr:protein tyrosine phosphatase [Sulfurimonas autotrophica]